MWKTVAIIFFSNALCTAPSSAYSTRIPTPNVCNSPATSTLKQGSWSSKDCPIDALCVPDSAIANATGFCSCSYTEDMFHTRSDGRCVASTATKIYAAFWCVSVVLAAAQFVWMFVIAFNARRQQITLSLMMNTLPFLTSLVLACLIVNRAFRIVQLVGNVPQHSKSFIQNAASGTLALLSFGLIALTLTFGVAVHMLLLTTAKFRSLQMSKIRRRVIWVAISGALLIFIGNAILLFLNQYGLMVLYSGVFVVALWTLYGRIAKVSVDTVQSPPQSKASRDSRTSDHANAVLTHIQMLSRRLSYVMALFMVCCAAYTTLWFAGRAKRNSSMLGLGKAVVTALFFVLYLAGIASIIHFFGTLCRLRSIRKKMSAVSSTSRASWTAEQQANL